jgi:hypothetical protein
MEDIDNTWANNYLLTESQYNIFYPEIPQTVTLFFLYINTKNELECLHKDSAILDNGILHSSTIATLVNTRSKLSTQRYRLSYLLMYNNTNSPQQIIDNQIQSTKLTLCEPLRNASFANTIAFLSDLNSLFFIFRAIKPSSSKSRKIYNSNTNRQKTLRKYT